MRLAPSAAYLGPAVGRFISAMATAAPEVPALVRDRAFEKLYRLYVKDVYRYALALLRDPAEAEDVTQTTFMNAYRAFKRGERIEKPQHWLIKIAHNAARSRYAHASRRVSEVPLDEHLEQLAVPEAERPDIQAVLDALSRLPLNQRAALVMRELEGRTYAEIADAIGVSVAAVETLIFRARRSLRLKASAIRVLGTVPIPSSLSQFVGAGSVAAGGGAVLGSGVVLKAAIAIVAGVVASGINSDSPSGADAATSRAAPFASTKSARDAAQVVRTQVVRLRNAGRVTRSPRTAAQESGISVSRKLRTDDVPDRTASPAPDTRDPGRASVSGGDATSASPTSSPADTVTSATTPVEAASTTVGAVTTALPVQSPVPAAAPALPSPPPLPPPPQLPALP